MPSQPNETVREDIANALQILASYERELARSIKWVEMDVEDVRAVMARLNAALKKLDAQGKWVQLSYADGVELRPMADGAALPGQPIPPLDYAVPSEEEE